MKSGARRSSEEGRDVEARRFLWEGKRKENEERFLYCSGGGADTWVWDITYQDMSFSDKHSIYFNVPWFCHSNC